MIKIILSGCNGKMGQVVSRIVAGDDYAEIVCGVDINAISQNDYPVVADLPEFSGDADVIIDFSHPSSLSGILSYATAKNTPAVIATTGLSKAQIEQLHLTAKTIPVFFSANMSLGINLLIDLVCKATKLLSSNFDIEIIEKHHNKKIDAPSGTALAIADAISEVVPGASEYVFDRHSVRKPREKREIGLHAVRGGTIVGEHSVIFAGVDEIIEVNHIAMSKEIFAVGAVSAAKFIAGKPPALYSMKELVETIV